MSRYKQVYHGEPPPDVKGMTVAVIDFYYDGQDLKNMLGECKALITLDHHFGAIEAVCAD
jgi:hypothetical protein